MARLEWDKETEKLYETGVRNLVLYKRDAQGAYTRAYAWNGVTGITASPDGAEPTDLYADDVKYLTLRSAETFGCTIEAYMYPPEFESCDGSAEIAPGVSIGQQNRESFGLCYRTVLGNDAELDNYGYKLHIVYGCTASPSEKAYESINDSPEAITFSWEISTTPVNVSGFKPTATVEINSKTADSTKLTRLENILYGDENTTARLPLPAEIMSIMGTAVTPPPADGDGDEEGDEDEEPAG